MRFEKNEKKIRKDIGTCITRSMNATIKACVLPTVDEPDFIAGLVEHLPQGIQECLSAFTYGYNISVAGIFCHQKPLADYGGSKKAELGDILLVYIEENRYSVKKCNAVLMQAKKIIKDSYIVHESEEHQLKLYEEWPKFKLSRAGAFNGRKFNILPKTLNTGAQYLLMKSPFDDEKLFRCSYPDKELRPGKFLADQIIDLMKFFTGRTFVLTESEDDWSNLILELIRISCSSHFNRRKSGKVNADRMVVFGDESFFEGLTGDEDIDESVAEDSIPCLIIYASEIKEDYQQHKLKFN